MPKENVINKKIKQFFIFFVAALILSNTSFSANKNEESRKLEQKEKELRNIYNELIRQKEKLRQTKRQEKNVKQKLFIINRDLKKTKDQLEKAQNQIAKNVKRIGTLKVSLEDAAKRMDERNIILRKRIKEIYKSGGINYLELMVASDTLGDFINRTYFFEKLLRRDTSLLDEIKTEHKIIKTNKTSLESVTDQIRVLERFVKDKKKNIEKQAEEKKQVYLLLEGRRREYEKRIAKLEETSNEIEELIKKYIAQRDLKGGPHARGTGSFIWPLRGKITSTYGYRRNPFWRGSHLHTGLDISNSYGSPIQAADSGEIIFTGWWDGYGKAIIIDHGKDTTTVYAHLSRIYVQKGQAIKKGQIIGLEGSSGFSTGPHLHFEVRKFGKPQNPQKWLP